MIKRSFGLLAAMLLLGACAGASLHRYPHETTHILSPLTEGAVDTNVVQVLSPGVESQFGIAPGTLVDEGVLTALDTNQVCVQVTVRDVTEMGRQTPPLTMFHVFLRANQSVRDDARVENVTQSVGAVQGTRARQVQTGMERYCAGVDRYGNCYSWGVRPTYTTVYDPVMYQLTTQQGTACFMNAGFITPDTDEMEIYFVSPDRSDGVGFEWRFDIAE